MMAKQSNRLVQRIAHEQQENLTTEQLAAKALRDLKEMSPEKKAQARAALDREFKQKNIFVAPDGIVNQLREWKQPVTRESYAELAYWKSYRSLSAEEKFEVREAVYEANIQ